MNIKFLGKAKMIGEVTYWAPPIWKFWQWKQRHRIIADAKYCAKELAAGREPYPDAWDDENASRLVDGKWTNGEPPWLENR